MSQTQYLFSAQAKVTTFAATTLAPTPKQLANSGMTVRIVNLSQTDGAYIAFGETAATAIATLPVDGSAVSCWAAPGSDFTVSIPGNPGNTALFASAISAAGAPNLLFYVGNGS